MRAYLLTCEERADVCAETVADLERTDWGPPPTVVIDAGTAPTAEARIVDTGRRVLARAVDEADGDDDVVLVCEDDVIFNRSIRHNLERWGPIVDRRPDRQLFGSLYNPNVVAPDPDGESAVVADPRNFYGTQAVVMSVVTARSLLEQWNDGPGPLDLRISRLAARWSPVWFHRPSLVQHREIVSTWGGVAHFAVDFSPDWRA
jgi:hypothetical protein